MGFEAELAAFENSEDMDQTLLMGDDALGYEIGH